MRKFLFAVIGVLLASRAEAQYAVPPNLQVPASGLVLAYTAGQITSGGTQQAIPVGSVTVADMQGNCAAPQFAGCNLIYWPGSGTVLLSTTNPGTAFQAGNVVVGFVTSVGGNITAAVIASATVVPVGVSTSASSSSQVPSTFRLPLCNALLTQGCQASTKSLSGY